MPEQQATEQKQVRRGSSFVSPFEVESYGKNCSEWHSVIMHKTFRGQWSRTRLGPMSTSVGQKMGNMPDIPGLRIRIMPKDSKICVHDPLEHDKLLVKEINNVLRNAGLQECEPVQQNEQVLDEDTFKTFVVEVCNTVNKKEPSLRLVSGQLPTPEEIESMPGRELYDPASPYRHAKYVGDEDRYSNLLDELEKKGIKVY